MTKTLKMALKAGILLALAAGFMPRYAHSENLNESQLAINMQTQETRRVSFATTTANQGNDYAALNLTYVGSSTEAVVTISSAGGTFYAPSGVLDTSIGVGGIVFANTVNGANLTIGQFCDSVNLSVNYRCTMLDSRRSDQVTMLLDQTQAGGNASTNLKGVGGYNVPLSSGSTTSTADTAQGPLTLCINPLPGKRVILQSCQVGVLTANQYYSATFTVTGVNAKFENDQTGRLYNDSTLAFQMNVSSITETKIFFYDPTGGAPTWGGGGLRFAKGQATVPGPSGTPPGAANIGRVCVRADPSDRNAFPPPASGNYAYGNTGQFAPSYLQCWWIEQGAGN